MCPCEYPNPPPPRPPPQNSPRHPPAAVRAAPGTCRSDPRSPRRRSRLSAQGRISPPANWLAISLTGHCATSLPRGSQPGWNDDVAQWPAKDMADSGEEMVGQEWSSGVGGGQRGERRRRVGGASSKRKGVAIFKALFLAIRKHSFIRILES